MVDAVRIIEGVMGARYFEDDITVDPARCVAARSRKLTCRRCVEVCPAEAIRIEPRRVAVDQGVCTHCGACVAVCPTQAVASAWQPWKSLFSRAVEAIAPTGGHPVIACEKARLPHGRGKVARVECLGCVDESLLLAVLASGARDVRLESGDCASCGMGCPRTVWELAADGAAAMLAAAGIEGERILRSPDAFPAPAGTGAAGGADSAFAEDIALDRGPGPYDVPVSTGASVVALGASDLSRGPSTPSGGVRAARAEDSDAENVPVGEVFTRRDLFGSLRGRAAKAAEGIASGLAEDSRYRVVAGVLGIDATAGSSPFDGASRGQICAWALVALAELGGNAAPADTLIPSRIFSEVEIDGVSCTKCFLCVAYCQTKALEKAMDGHRAVGIVSHPLLCTQCRACVDICRPKAAALTGSVPLSALR